MRSHTPAIAHTVTTRKNVSWAGVTPASMITFVTLPFVPNRSAARSAKR
jgi:hypothetical protein